MTDIYKEKRRVKLEIQQLRKDGKSENEIIDYLKKKYCYGQRLIAELLNE